MSAPFKVGDRINVLSYGNIVPGTIHRVGERSGMIFYHLASGAPRWCFPESATLVEEEESNDA